MSQVHWYPGHMAKAMRLIEEQIKVVDFVIECRDARAPFSTRNPALSKSIGQKRRLIVLTKKDLADPKETEKWVAHLEEEGHVVLVVDVIHDAVKKLLLEKSEIVLKDKRERDARRGIRPRQSRALIVGVPNVGKSSIINRIASRKAAGVENRPGVTQALKLIKVSEELELVDTPGVLWPKFESQDMGIHCALIGSVKDTGYPLELITDHARDYLIENKQEVLKDRYNMTSYDNFYQQIGTFRGLLTEGGEVDDDKVRITFLNDVQNGKLGRLTWDRL
ncbi:ribosome biogenesis GTPase YlqF [Erysipelothrix sp. HDW6C]|uniref:ribosome biogenesis GTPase YlqF n=1 Tax=Erysipelothrix sp. HDW6C TaxID=2714930 RepID=UPI00140CEF43|nr:ribosome biogenesis GTPase YlqF [Erysipelothrix sp. HDW6C]QIK70392.1 ribosome biogenesis GTPase YlqF [Erysipelothrix sp. HDW6C]